ncbi:hypothetical protein ACFW04_014227 [Cataglyphis niger]
MLSCRNRSDCQNWKKRNILSLNLSYIPNEARICSAQFKEEFLNRTNPSKIRLRPNALPFKIEEEEEVCCIYNSVEKYRLQQIKL